MKQVKLFCISFTLLLFLFGCSYERSVDEIREEMKEMRLPLYSEPNIHINDFINRPLKYNQINLMQETKVYVDDNYKVGSERLIVRHSQINWYTNSDEWNEQVINTPYIWVTDIDLLDVNHVYDDINLDNEVQNLYTDLNIQSTNQIELFIEIIYKLTFDYKDQYSTNGNSLPHAFFKGEQLNGKGFTELARLVLQKAGIYSDLENVLDKDNHLRPGLRIDMYFTSVEKIMDNPKLMSKYILLTDDEMKTIGLNLGNDGSFSDVMLFDNHYYASSSVYKHEKEKIRRDIINLAIDDVTIIYNQQKNEL